MYMRAIEKSRGSVEFLIEKSLIYSSYRAMPSDKSINFKRICSILSFEPNSSRSVEGLARAKKGEQWRTGEPSEHLGSWSLTGDIRNTRSTEDDRRDLA